MACLSGLPRSADVIASEAGEILELRRNVLDRLMRLPSQRARFESLYRERALDLVLQGADLFKELAGDEFQRVVEYLRPRLSFLRVSRGQTLFKQGDPARDMYLVRLGNVQVAVQRYGNAPMIVSRAPGSIVGEIGLLAIRPQDVGKTADQIDKEFASAFERAGTDLTNAIPAGFRSATCAALDHLELARINRADFLEMVRQFPNLRHRLIRAIARGPPQCGQAHAIPPGIHQAGSLRGSGAARHRHEQVHALRRLYERLASSSTATIRMGSRFLACCEMACASRTS